ncbi:MAG: hypothetical protein HN982_04995 [Candidatus Marinimicrobia bacterium]|nr:hypothetical protein [Candidatus Neomarinimicrobiota bacterium]
MERSKNIFDKIGSLIPGYRGYAERDGRRNCDKLLRNQISERLIYCESIINNRIKSEVKNNNLGSLRDLEDCQQKLNTLSDKIKYAPYGESSFFGDSQIKENELQNIYELDFELYTLLQESEKYLIDTTIVDILMYISSIDTMIKKRNDFIKEHK